MDARSPMHQMMISQPYIYNIQPILAGLSGLFEIIIITEDMNSKARWVGGFWRELEGNRGGR